MADNQTTNPLNDQRQNVTNALDITIQLIQQVHDLVPLDIAKNVLQAITSILTLVQKSIKNKDDSNALVRNCKAICSTLALASTDISVDHMSDALSNALSELELSINELQSKVGDAAQQGRMRRFFAATINERQITGWAVELNTIFVSFTTRLNIVSSLRLEQIYELLKRSEVPSLAPEPPPPPPAMFFGRETLFKRVKDALLNDEDVTLIGPGGIGKSCIAKALINDDDIKKRYPRRFFVSYDGMDPTTITSGAFVDRISRALGLSMVGAEGKHKVISNLGLSPVLMVLDNAETFEDAANPDVVDQISSIVSDIANTSGVTVILTSRTSRNARNACWTEFIVTPLEKIPAREYFRRIYRGSDISDNDIDGLLGALDFHPLSIHILAHTARESRWTGKELIDEWEAQQSRLLQRGNKKENLGFTIRMSLSSPSVRNLGEDALNVLRVTLFFPQGVNRNHVTRLFPTIPNISLLMDTLCQVSLVYRSGPFVTTLAPIRLFLLDVFPNAGIELLEDIRHVYYDSLQAISREKDTHADLIACDHFNIEHLIAYDMTRISDNIQDAVLACKQFLWGLNQHKVRPTLLAPSIFSLPEDLHSEKDDKAHCLFWLARLYSSLSSYVPATEAYLAANRLFVSVGNHSMVISCTDNAAISCTNRGRFSQARRLLEDLICSTSWQCIDEGCRAGIYSSLDFCKMHMSHESANNLFFEPMNNWERDLESQVRHWQAKIYHGYSIPEEVERNLEPFRSDSLSSSDPWDRWVFLEALAEAAFMQQKYELAMELLNQARDAVDGHYVLSLEVLCGQTAIASAQGNYDLARSLLQHTLDTLSVVATSLSIGFLDMRFVHSRNELYAKRYSEARYFLVDIAADCDVQDNIGTKMSCKRALGEIELLLGRKTESDWYFAGTVELCKEAGVPPELLDVCRPMWRLDDDRFPGWRRFLQAQAE